MAPDRSRKTDDDTVELKPGTTMADADLPNSVAPNSVAPNSPLSAADPSTANSPERDSPERDSAERDSADADSAERDSTPPGQAETDAPTSAGPGVGRRILRWTLVIAALIGAFFSWRSTQHRLQLQAEFDRLELLVGSLPIANPDLVWVAQIPPSEGDRTATRRIWRFRVYFPAGYKAGHQFRMGPIAASSPYAARASGGSSYLSPNRQPLETVMTFAMIKGPDGWRLHTNRGGGRGRMSILKLGQLLDQGVPVIETPVGANGPVSFTPNQPICLLRVRGEDEVEMPNAKEPVYPGVYFYLVPIVARTKFDAARTGKPPATPASNAPTTATDQPAEK